MQQWNQHFSDENREDNIHREDRVTNRNSDFNQNSSLNTPHDRDRFRNPYTDMHQHNDVYSNYHSERFRNQQPYSWEEDMKMEQRGRNIERDWQQLRNWADDVQRRNNMGGSHAHNPYMNQSGSSNHGETYNHHNRNYNPMFADDEGGFSGGHRNDEHLRSGYNRDFGFDRGNSFHNQHPQSWPENNNTNQHEGQNRWKRNHGNSSQNRGGFFGH
mgnify:CR=1 FL=1